jgi:hypothetical protein
MNAKNQAIIKLNVLNIYGFIITFVAHFEGTLK